MSTDTPAIAPHPHASPNMGISGRIAKIFLQSQMTPLIALIAFLLGLFAVLVTPREEEPQINVTMANVFIPFPGASAKDVESLVATPAEQVLSQITGIEHVYSVSQARHGGADRAIQGGRGSHPGAGAPVRHRPVATATGSRPISASASPSSSRSASTTCRSSASPCGRATPRAAPTSCEQVAHAAEIELKRIKGTREVKTLGGAEPRGAGDAWTPSGWLPTAFPRRTSAMPCRSANASQPSGTLVDEQPRNPGADRHLPVQRRGRQAAGGRRCRGPPGIHDRRGAGRGRPRPAGRYVWHGHRRRRQPTRRCRQGRIPGGDPGGFEEAGRERGGRRRARHRARRAAAGHA